MTATLHYTVHRVGPRIGAEIEGVDLTRRVDDATAQALREEFHAHNVLVFRGANLTPDQQVEAVRIFDEPFDHPTAIRHPDNRLVYPYRVSETGKASHWHIGGLWRNPPFSIESLVYEEVAPLGGHTPWADLQAADDDLSAPFKTLLESVVYDADPDLSTPHSVKWRRHRGRLASRSSRGTRRTGPTAAVGPAGLAS